MLVKCPGYSLYGCTELLRWFARSEDRFAAAEYLITTWWDCPFLPSLFMILANFSSGDTRVVKGGSRLA